MKTEIIKCSCEHKYQDEKYGLGMRVHNQIHTLPTMSDQFRCTVCGKVKGLKNNPSK